MRSSMALRSAGGSLTAIPIESFARGGIISTAASGAVSLARYSDSYTATPGDVDWGAIKSQAQLEEFIQPPPLPWDSSFMPSAFAREKASAFCQMRWRRGRACVSQGHIGQSECILAA